SAATFIGYHNWLFLSTIFLFFFKTFFHRSSMCFGRNVPPFSAASYIIPKHLTKVNNKFDFFYFS
uniref:hypothetical protein n=1 Tax=Clostridium sp. NkU-1 TaxID=1095009 RepID=UPI003261C6DB